MTYQQKERTPSNVVISHCFFLLDWHGRLSEWVTWELACQAAAWKNFDDVDKASFLTPGPNTSSTLGFHARSKAFSLYPVPSW